MKSIEHIKRILEDNKDILKDKFKVIEIGIFGSYVRGEETITSDIDILVEFEKEGKTFDNYIELKYFLEELLGIKVDLVMKGALKQELKDIILQETIYV
jgi:predicted nucleotidyltransferase